MNRLKSNTFRIEVEAAKTGVEMFLASYPDDQMLKSIAKQLEFVIDWSEKGADLQNSKLDALNFGLMASHAVADLDAHLEMALHQLSGEIRDARNE